MNADNPKMKNSLDHATRHLTSGFYRRLSAFIGGSALLLISTPSDAQQLYKCTLANGRVQYQQEPCLDATKQSTVRPPDPIAPKSDAGYQALNQARALVSQSPAEPVPMQLRNASTRSMKEWGYGEGYQHAHEFEDGINTMQCLPDALKGAEFYHPTARGTEQRIAERLAAIRQRKSQE